MGTLETLLPELIDRFVVFSIFLGNAFVFVLTLTTYQSTGRRCLLLIALSAGIGGILAIVPRIPGITPSWTFWGFWSVATLVDFALWLTGVRLLVREYGDLVTQIAKPSALLDEGSTTPTENPKLIKEPTARVG